MSDGGAVPESWRRLSPLTIAAQMLRGVANAALPLAFVLYGAISDNAFAGIGLAVLISAAPLVLGAIAGLTALSWWRQRYRVGEHDIRLEQGLISRSARSVPFERIQDVSLEQGLVQRLLGLVEVRFETGAGGKDELKLAYVTAADGEALRETVRARSDSEEAGPLPAAIAGEPVTGEASQVLFAMDPKRLLTFGLFEFSLVVFAVLIGAMQQFEFLLPFDPWDIEDWEERLAGPGDWLEGLGFLSQIAGIVAMLTVVLVLGFATGIVRTVLRDFGFLLERTAKGFRRRRGLLTRTDVVMPVHRVQAVRLTTGILRRRWGWYGLSFISLAQDAKSANHDVVPFAQLDEIAPVAAEADFPLPSPDSDWRRGSPKYYTDMAIIGAIVPGGAAVGAIAFGYSWAGLGLAAIGALLAVRAHFLWRHDRHVLNERQVIYRRGWLAPKMLVASRIKLHSVEIAQGPLARRRGYADVNFGLAGGRLSFAGLRLEDASRLRAATLESIAAVDFTRLLR